MTVDDFYRPPHRIIFGEMARLAAHGQPLDNVTLREALSTRSLLDKARGASYLVDLVEATPGASNVAAYADIVRERAAQRRLISVAREIDNAAHKPLGRTSADLLDEAEDALFGLRRGQADTIGGRDKALNEAMALIDKWSRHDGPVTGVPSGFADLDSKTTGWQAGDLVIVAGRPSTGKTALLVAMAIAAGAKGPALLFSMEQPRSQLGLRMLSAAAGIPLQRLRKGELRDGDWESLGDARERLLGRAPLIDQSSRLSTATIRARAARVSAEHRGLALIAVDYLQLMEGGGRDQNRNLEVGAISRSLKAIAKDLDCPVICASQLNRDVERRDRRPRLVDLRDSGEIEQNADVVLALHRDGHHTEALVLKQRNGPLATVRLSFDGDTVDFASADDDGNGFGGPVAE